MITIEEFLALSPAGQVKYLKTEAFAAEEKGQRTQFLTRVAAAGVSSKCLACALKILRELKHHDRAFYRRFLGHPDSSVTMACKKALSDHGSEGVLAFQPMREIVKKRNNETKLETVRLIVSEANQASEEMLVAFLGEDNLKVRELVVRELSQRPQLDEARLAAQLAHAIWFTRAAIVEILGNRRSSQLLARAGDLANDVNAEVRLKLLEALAKQDRAQVRDLILKLTHDPHVRVSGEAKRLYATL